MQSTTTGEASYVMRFKYLGGAVDPSGTCDAEVVARISKAKGRFAQMQRVWGLDKLKLSLKMQCFRAYVMPILLFGSESWALKSAEADTLDRVQTHSVLAADPECTLC
jgi:hypothetical protein